LHLTNNPHFVVAIRFTRLELHVFRCSNLNITSLLYVVCLLHIVIIHSWNRIF